MTKIVWPFVALIALSACDSSSNVRITSKDSDASRSALKVVDALQCPTDQGVLVRRGTASDGGQTCTYAGPRGAEVKLHLVALNGRSSDEVLRRFQDEVAPDASKSPIRTDVVEDGEDSTATVRMPGLSVESGNDRATVSLPGMRIEADGDRANIRIGGLTIRADDKGSEITSRGDDTTAVITANDSGANIRTEGTGAIRSTMMNVVANPGPAGWRVVGYEARGPSGGPVVVATFRSRDREADDIISAAKALVSLNVGD